MTSDDTDDTDAQEEFGRGFDIDERMRDRRVAVLREKGTRRLRIFTTGIAILTIIGIGWLVLTSPALAVTTVEIRGAVDITQEAVREAARVSVGDALLLVNSGSVVQRVEELPMIESASAHRDFPHDFLITVVERTPVAWVSRGDGSAPRSAAVVDATGRVIAESTLPPDGLPEISGVKSVPQLGVRISPAQLAGIPDQLPEALRTQVQSIKVDGSQVFLTLRVVPGAQPSAGEIRMGAPTMLAQKGAAALAVLDALALQGERVTYIDVRVPTAIATDSPTKQPGN